MFDYERDNIAATSFVSNESVGSPKIRVIKSIKYKTEVLPHSASSGNYHGQSSNQTKLPNQIKTTLHKSAAPTICEMNKINDRYIFQTVYQRDYCRQLPRKKCPGEKGYDRPAVPPQPEPNLRLLKWPETLKDINDYIYMAS